MRTTKGAARTKAKRRLLQKAKGYVGGRRRLLRTVKETLVRAEAFAFRDRRAPQAGIPTPVDHPHRAACRERGISYSVFMNGLKKAQIELDRKMLSEIAIFDPAAFDKIVEEAKAGSAA